MTDYKDKLPCPAQKCRQWFETEKALKQHWGNTHQGSLARTERVCKQCGDSFTVSTKSDQFLCSQACAGKWNRKDDDTDAE